MLRNQCCKHSKITWLKITLISSTSAFTMPIRDKWHKKPACGRVLFAFAITYKIGKISDLHEIYAFQSTFATLCFENAAFCFERVLITNNKASLSSR